MNFDSNLEQYIGWDVTNVWSIRGKYGFRISLRYADDSEVTRQKSGFSTKSAAKTARDKVIGELHGGTYVVYENVRYKEYLEYWLEKIMKPKITYDSYYSYRTVIYRHIIPRIDNVTMSNLHRGKIQKLYNDVAEYSKSQAPLVKTIIKNSLEHAVIKKAIAENPSKGIMLPRSIGKKAYRKRTINVKKTLNKEQVNVLIEASKETPIYMQILFAVLMGLRKGEINGLKYTDIDYIRRTLKVERQLGIKPNTKPEDFDPKTYGKQEIPPKTPSSFRELPIPDLVFESILEQRKVYEKNRRRRIREFQDFGYICCSTYGRPRSRHYHWKHFKKLLKENGLPDICFHDLRATYATLLLKNDFNLRIIANLLGHAKEIITVDVYGDNEQIIADCLSDIEPFIADVIPKEVEDANAYDIAELNKIAACMNEVILEMS